MLGHGNAEPSTDIREGVAMEPVLVEERDAVAIVRINRPERRNALTRAVKVALRDTLAKVADEDAIRAVVLAGAGEHFCAGQDLAEHAEALAADPQNVFATVQEHYAPITRSLATMPKPVVAAVEGVCVGAGLGFALAADLRVLSRSAIMGTAFTGIGLTCDSGLSYTLARAVGEARARELVLLGDTFTAEQAVAWGIAARVSEPGAAVEAATALATGLAAGPTAAYAESKLLLANPTSLEQSLSEESAAQTRLGRSDDHRSAVRAFLAKQRPSFTGR
jgi:2-(1,2-epoxy-1,2-dihydrophenyl)acetyl-CoA isomerase